MESKNGSFFGGPRDETPSIVGLGTTTDVSVLGVLVGRSRWSDSLGLVVYMLGSVGRAASTHTQRPSSPSWFFGCLALNAALAQ